MNISLLNQKIKIQNNKVLEDENYNHINVWSDYYDCFATISGESGKEKEEAGQTQNDSNISFTVRYCKKLASINTLNYRVLFNGEVYNIVAIDHLNYKKKAIKLVCKRKSYG